MRQNVNNHVIQKSAYSPLYFTPSSWSLQYVAYVVTDCCISFCFSSVVIVRVVFPWTFSPKFTDPESRCYSPAVSLHQRDVAQLAYSPGHFQRGIGCKESVQDFKTSLEDDGLWIRCKCECRDTKRYYVVMSVAIAVKGFCEFFVCVYVYVLCLFIFFR